MLTPSPSIAKRNLAKDDDEALGLGGVGGGRSVPGVISKDNAFYLGHLGPIPLYVHWSFLLLVYVLWVMMPFNGANAENITFFLTFISVLMTAVVLHELGHGLAARTQGELGITITLMAFGGVCSSTRSGRPWRELIIVLAGPLVSAILWVGCMVAWNVLADQAPQVLVDRETRELTLTGMALILGKHINFMLLIFNMMPIFPLDGGQAVHNLMLMFLPRQTANRISMAVAFVGVMAYISWRVHQAGQVDTNLIYVVCMMLFMLWNAYLYLNRR